MPAWMIDEFNGLEVVANLLTNPALDLSGHSGVQVLRRTRGAGGGRGADRGGVSFTFRQILRFA
jgi:hypothetical protein